MARWDIYQHSLVKQASLHIQLAHLSMGCDELPSGNILGAKFLTKRHQPERWPWYRGEPDWKVAATQGPQNHDLWPWSVAVEPSGYLVNEISQQPAGPSGLHMDELVEKTSASYPTIANNKRKHNMTESAGTQCIWKSNNTGGWSGRKSWMNLNKQKEDRYGSLAVTGTAFERTRDLPNSPQNFEALWTLNINKITNCESQMTFP